MALAKDLSGLPVANDATPGDLPARKPMYATAIAQAWEELFSDTKEHPANLPMATTDARIRHSWAGMCARRIGYAVTGEPETEPPTSADRWRFRLGHLVHDDVQAAFSHSFPGAQIEVKLPNGELAGTADVVLVETIDSQEKKTCFELKSINGFGYKKAIGARGAAEGPRASAKLQGALNALAANADELVLIYVATELLSPREAAKLGGSELIRFMAEWRYSREEFEPWALEEKARLDAILATIDIGLLPDRQFNDPEIPSNAVIVDPAKGFWQVIENRSVIDAGTTWQCAYCPFRSRCLLDLSEEKKAA